MLQSIEFAKLSGSGNDFLCLDSREGQFDELLAKPAAAGQFARVLCRHGMGVGADGLIFAVRPEIDGVAHIGARFFEPDGSEAELCGNGTACFTRWVLDNGWVADEEVKILTTAGVVRGRRSDDHYIRVCITLPENMLRGLTVSAGRRQWDCDFAVTGVPHLIAYVDDVAEVDVLRYGPMLRHHEQFAPKGVNANFVQVIKPGEIAIRTFEYGVEGETLACGTGSAAAAIMAAQRFNWPNEILRGERPVLVHARSGDILRVYFVLTGGAVSDLCLETVVRFLFNGVLHADLAERACRLHKGV
jgi:diaminopimelate epimerase